MHKYMIISSEIHRRLHYQLTELLDVDPPKPGDTCTVFLTTTGGDPHAGYRIARCLRHHYPNGVRMAIPSYCKSAGTLITISANELGIGDLGELGPLDMQLGKPSEFRQLESGLEIQQAMQSMLSNVTDTFQTVLLELKKKGGLSTRLAGDFAAKIAVGTAEPLYAQVDPNRLGEVQRAMQVTHEYAQRLDAYGRNLKDDALLRLVAGYPSHGFVIDRKEAATLFHRVSQLTDEEKTYARIFWPFIGDQAGIAPEFVTIPPAPTGVNVNASPTQSAPIDPPAAEPENNTSGSAEKAAA